MYPDINWLKVLLYFEYSRNEKNGMRREPITTVEIHSAFVHSLGTLFNDSPPTIRSIPGKRDTVT
jgi:hypothetical protein